MVGWGHGSGHAPAVPRAWYGPDRKKRRRPWSAVSLQRALALAVARASTEPSAARIAGSMSDPRDKWTTFHFSQSNPDGPGQGHVPSLLRRVADSIEALGDVMVEDITFSSEVTADERDISMTVYYHRD